MRIIYTVLCFCLMASAAFAVADSGADRLGLYFDLQADQNMLDVGANVPFFAYVTITNPTAAEVYGLEFGYRIDVQPGFEGLFFRLANDLPPMAINLGNSDDKLAGDYVVGLAVPLPAATTVQFVTWKFMMLTVMDVYFHLGPSSIESIADGLPAYEIGGQIRPLGVSQPFGEYSACVNGCAVATETQSFGAVKSLYR